MEALGLQSRSVTWHHSRWAEKPAGLRLGDMMRKTNISNRIVVENSKIVTECALYTVKCIQSSLGCSLLKNICITCTESRLIYYQAIEDEPNTPNNISLSTFLASLLKCASYDQLRPTEKHECVRSFNPRFGDAVCQKLPDRYPGSHVKPRKCVRSTVADLS